LLCASLRLVFLCLMTQTNGHRPRRKFAIWSYRAARGSERQLGHVPRALESDSGLVELVLPALGLHGQAKPVVGDHVHEVRSGACRREPMRRLILPCADRYRPAARRTGGDSGHGSESTREGEVCLPRHQARCAPQGVALWIFEMRMLSVGASFGLISSRRTAFRSLEVARGEWRRRSARLAIDPSQGSASSYIPNGNKLRQRCMATDRYRMWPLCRLSDHSHLLRILQTGRSDVAPALCASGCSTR